MTLNDLLGTLRRYAAVCVVAAAVGATLGYLWISGDAQYVASAEVLIDPTGENQNQTFLAQQQRYVASLAVNASSSVTAEAVAERIEDLETEFVRNAITASALTNSNILRIEVATGEEGLSRQIADEVIEIVVGSGDDTLGYPLGINVTEDAPSPTLLVFAALAGAAVVGGVVLALAHGRLRLSSRVQSIGDLPPDLPVRVSSTPLRLVRTEAGETVPIDRTSSDWKTIDRLAAELILRHPEPEVVGVAALSDHTTAKLLLDALNDAFDAPSPPDGAVDADPMSHPPRTRPVHLVDLTSLAAADLALRLRDFDAILVVGRLRREPKVAAFDQLRALASASPTMWSIWVK